MALNVARVSLASGQGHDLGLESALGTHSHSIA